MARYLSAEWLAEARVAAREARGDGHARLVIQQVVTGTPDGEVRYAVQVDAGSVDVTPGEADEPDVTFTTDWATASGMATGSMGAQDAFVAGRLEVHGDMSVLLANAPGLAAMDHVFASVRERTTF